MGRIAGLAEGIRRSGVRLGPLDGVFGVMDYADGKSQGEDDIRAGAGAVGSTLGGWGGAVGGAAAGAAIGSAVPVIGTAIGSAVGAIAGGTLGGFAGGWGADRTDELIRDKGNKMKQLYDENGNPVRLEQKADGSWGMPDIIAGGLGLGAAGFAGKSIVSNFTNPQSIYNTARISYGATPKQATQAVIGNVGSDVMRGLRQMPMGAKVAGGAAIAYGTNKVLGNPVGGVADAITGNAYDFDGKGRPPTQNSANYQRDQREVNQTYSIPNYEKALSPEQMANAAGNREDYVYHRNFRDKLNYDREGKLWGEREKAMFYRAEQAKDLVTAYASLIPDAIANQMQALGSWR